MNGNAGLRFVAALVLIGVIAAIGYFAFQAGVAQGSPITIEAPSGETAPMPYSYHYGWGMPYHRPFGFFGFLVLFFLFFVALRALRFLFWGPRWGWGHPMGHHGGHGPWGRWETGVPPMFEEWHKRAHGETTEDKKE